MNRSSAGVAGLWRFLMASFIDSDKYSIYCHFLFHEEYQNLSRFYQQWNTGYYKPNLSYTLTKRLRTGEQHNNTNSKTM